MSDIKSESTSGSWVSTQRTPKSNPLIQDRVTSELIAIVHVRYKDDGRAMVPQLKEAGARARLIAAAPEMAQALLAWVRAGESGNPSDIPDLDEKSRIALKKAGVL